MSSNNMSNLTEIILEILQAMKRAFQKLFSISTENNLKETEATEETSPTTSTKKLSSLFPRQKKKQEKETDDGSSGKTGWTWFDDITRDLYQHLNEEEIYKLMEEVEKDPDRKRKFKKYLRKRKDDSLAKKIRTVLELKLKHKKHLKYKTALQKRTFNRIITTASKKLHKRLNKQEKQLAVDYFKNNYHDNFSPVQLANIALLGVITASYARGLRPVVQGDWSNPFGMTDYNAYNENSLLTHGKRMNYALGLWSQAVITSLRHGIVLLPETTRLLKLNGVSIDKFINQPSSQEKKLFKLRMR